MSQNILQNTTTPPLAGSTAIGVINGAADSLAKWWGGASAPTTGATGLTDLKGFVWHDTSGALLKVRDQADANWMTLGSFDETNKKYIARGDSRTYYVADTGAANAYAAAPTIPWTSYTYDGPFLAFMPAHTNTTASTINVSTLGAKAITRQDGSALLPNDIVAGQVAVCVWNPTAGGFNLLTQKATPLAFVKSVHSNLVISSIGFVKTATISADAVVLLDSNNNAYMATSVAQTPSLASSGAGGLDTGAVAANTLYSEWLIYNPTTVTLSALFSLSATAPTLPSGYTYKARVGWCLTDGSSNVLAFHQYNEDLNLDVTNVNTLTKVATGSAGNITGTYAFVNNTAFCPSTASHMRLLIYNQNVILGLSPDPWRGAHQSTTNPPWYGSEPSTSNALTETILVPNQNSGFYWFNNDPGSTRAIIYGAGWKDNL